MERLDWDSYFVEMAVLTALRSGDPSTKVGAVLVDEHRTVISTGYNGFPRGIDPTRQERLFYGPKDEKYRWVVHAEANAIYNAGRQGKPLLGTTMYTTWPTCSDCAKMIVQVGIKRVVFIPDTDTSHWQDSFAKTREVFDACGVEFVAYERTQPLILQRLIAGNVGP